MDEEDSYPIGMHIALTLVGLVLVNLAVTVFGSFAAQKTAPDPTFERASGRSMLSISRNELEDILSKSHASAGASTCASSSVDESLERHVEPGKKDDLLGNAEEMLQRASRLAGKAPRSLDKRKSGKVRSVPPTVIEVVENPSGNDGPDEETEIAHAVSAFEAAVNRSREAHRRALAAEKKRLNQSRNLLPGPDKPVIQPLPATPTSIIEKHNARAVARPKPQSQFPSSNAVGRPNPESPSKCSKASRVKETAPISPKPKATKGNKPGSPADAPKSQTGKTKKPKSLSKSKAHKNALLLATMSDEALAAMAKGRQAPALETELAGHQSAQLDTPLETNRAQTPEGEGTETAIRSESTTSPQSTETVDKNTAINEEIRESQRRLQDIMAQSGWQCACEGGLLPRGVFGGAESVLRMGMGQCYHNKKAA